MTEAAVLSGDELKAWRKARRAEFIARRVAVPDAQRRSWNERITAHLLEAIPLTAGHILGFCWPFRAEFDARYAVRRWRDSGVIAALPEVVAKARPLRFSEWWPGAPTRLGVYDIPVPDGTRELVPDALMAPMNAFDQQGYRLGYGGGYFDRTLAVAAPRPLVIGVTYELLGIETIYPQSYDVPMDIVVTEATVYAVRSGGIAPVDAAECREATGRLLAARMATSALSSPVCYADQFPGYWGEKT
jgi:5-formyltetrahydrofolate cyclo-ligase